MPCVEPKVELLAHSPEPLALIYAACRQCYHAGFVGDMWPKLLDGEISPEKQQALVQNILASGHASPVEHVSFTFALSGVSRALTHQLVRHRIASFSQQSQRYVNGAAFDYITPPAIKKNVQAKERFDELMMDISRAYGELHTLLEQDGRMGQSANEDARFVLPQAAASNIVLTMNCRTLIHFFEERCCTRAQWEIRGVANTMLAICKEKLPVIFRHAGAKCHHLGYCPEGKFSCGMYAPRDEN